MAKIFSYVIIIMLLSTLLHSQTIDTTENDSVALESIEEFETFDELRNEMKFFGDYYVGIDQVSVDNIRIFGGDLFVAGRLEGQIIVLGGDVTLESTSVVNGQVVAIGGSILKKEGAIVNGRALEANIREGISYSEGARPEYSDFQAERKLHRRDKRWIHPDIHWFTYNRNEGFLWTPLNWHWDRRGESSVRLSLSLGYRFGQRGPAGRFTLEKSFTDTRNLVLFTSVFRESRTDDGYRLPEKENSLAVLLARQDFYDRWDEEGYELGAGFSLDWLRLRGAYRSTEIDSIKVTRRLLKTFHKDRMFGPNRPVLPGSARSLLATLTARTPGLDILSTGAGLLARGEKVLKADAFDSFTRILGLVTANVELASDIVLRSRFLVGTADTLPEFRYFSVGGLGSVSGYPYKETDEADRLLQANFEIIFLPEFLHKDWLIALFADAGHAWLHTDHGFSDIETITDNARTAIGVGFGDDDMDWRVNIARPLDGRDFWETTFRLNMNF